MISARFVLLETYTQSHHSSQLCLVFSEVVLCFLQSLSWMSQLWEWCIQQHYLNSKLSEFLEKKNWLKFSKFGSLWWLQHLYREFQLIEFAILISFTFILLFFSSFILINRGDTDTFKFTTRNVGTIDSILLGHREKGEGQRPKGSGRDVDWHCHEVVVTDTSSGAK